MIYRVCEERLKTPVVVVDDLLGKGKTSWACQFMGESDPKERFIYVAPYLAETERIRKEMTHYRKKFIQPSDDETTKLKHFKGLIGKHENIVTTHALIDLWDEEVKELLKFKPYRFIVDESLEVVSAIEKSSCDIEHLLKAGALVKGEKGVLEWADENYKSGDNLKIKKKAESNRLRLSEGKDGKKAIVEEFDPNILKLFESVHFLTFMWEGQIIKWWFDLLGIPYVKKSVDVVEKDVRTSMIFTLEGEILHRSIHRYELVDWKKPDVSHLKELLHIYQGASNNNEKPRNRRYYDEFTFSKLEKLKPPIKKRGKDPINDPNAENIKKRFKNFLFNVNKAKAGEIMWTAPQASYEALVGKGYTNDYLSFNLRATNDYADRQYAIYPINKYLTPPIKNLFPEADEDRYALSEMLQWIFRGRIRKGESMKVFIPSYRMRLLMMKFLNGEI